MDLEYFLGTRLGIGHGLAALASFLCSSQAQAGDDDNESRDGAHTPAAHPDPRREAFLVGGHGLIINLLIVDWRAP